MRSKTNQLRHSRGTPVLLRFEAGVLRLLEGLDHLKRDAFLSEQNPEAFGAGESNPSELKL